MVNEKIPLLSYCLHDSCEYFGDKWWIDGEGAKVSVLPSHERHFEADFHELAFVAAKNSESILSMRVELDIIRRVWAFDSLQFPASPYMIALL